MYNQKRRIGEKNQNKKGAIMSEKKLVVTAKYGTLEFKESAHPYNPNAHQEQIESCVSIIHQQMKEAGKLEMKKSFKYSTRIEE